MNERYPASGLRAICCLFAVFALGLLAAVPDGSSAATLRAFEPGSGDPAPLARNLAVFWSQPPDLNGSKVSSEYISDLDLESEVANDFTTVTAARVTKVGWWGGDYNWEEGHPEVSFFDVNFYTDEGGTPGDLVDAYYFAQPTATLVGNDGLGYPVYRYELNVSFEVEAATTYWVGIQANYHTWPPQWGRQEAATILGGQAKFRSIYFGYEDWTNAESVTGEPWDASVEISIETPTIQACCYADGTCEMLLPADCVADGGVDQGVDTDCDPNPCPPPPPQACCFADQSCQVLDELDCYIAGGWPQGEGTDCSPNECPPVGACCVAGSLCLVYDETTCMESGGIFQGEGTDCDPNPCPAGEACCLAGGLCLVIDPDLCGQSGGTAQGPGTTCDPNPCEATPEACCFPDGSCQLLTPSGCNEANGTPYGFGSDCDPNPCPAPEPAACCFTDSHCVILTPEACLNAGGYYAGVGTVCDPNDCPYPVPTQKETWGSIKALFR